MPINAKKNLRYQKTGFPHEVTDPWGDTGTIYFRPKAGNREFWLKMQMLVMEHLAEKRKKDPNAELTITEDAMLKRKAYPGVVLVGWEDFEDFPLQEEDGSFSFANAQELLEMDWLSEELERVAGLSGARLRAHVKAYEDLKEKKAKGSEKPSSGESDTEPNSSDSTAEPPKRDRRSKKS